MFDALDHQYMARALQLAARGLYTTQPNPRVGCVLVRNKRVVAEGWHEYAGGPHAEIMALKKAGIDAEGATAYVTLEPCSHQGKTPPCVDALIAHRLARVVVAMQDPNPLVDGDGMQRLREAGVRVDAGLMASQAAALNPGFIKRMQAQRPFIRLKQGISLDGGTALANGMSQWISGENSRIDVHRLRARSSAILTGVDTVLSDNPAMTIRLESLAVLGELEAESSSRIKQPLRIIIDSNLRTPPDARVLKLPGDVLIVTVSDDPARGAVLTSDHVEVVRLPADERGKPDLHDLMSILAAGQVNELLVECGGRLAGALLARRLVDEIVLYVAPCLLGSSARGLFDIEPLQDMRERIELDIQEIRPIDRDIRIIARPVYKD
ncbi:MAG TPA: bifunctional diaminohydroxyphosphoribosylaminopyrimidine deaminase/5-amino-6-(5-phosphoribosylamino)uracil reductase RibD [Gammaproteobacteria bacterium]|nr:bifunctional diaminohydroxyphosphoribosylaminopyrimidine deaminase/5-amino-6-(5-phosphoribosylamino)uracil reductase RibD [Gammaproteobacteria bacterium]